MDQWSKVSVTSLRCLGVFVCEERQEGWGPPTKFHFAKGSMVSSCSSWSCAWFRCQVPSGTMVRTSKVRFRLKSLKNANSMKRLLVGKKVWGTLLPPTLICNASSCIQPKPFSLRHVKVDRKLKSLKPLKFRKLRKSLKSQNMSNRCMMWFHLHTINYYAYII